MRRYFPVPLHTDRPDSSLRLPRNRDLQTPRSTTTGYRPVLLAILSLVVISGLVLFHTDNVLEFNVSEFSPLATFCSTPIEHQRHSDPMIDYTDLFNITRDVFYSTSSLLKLIFKAPGEQTFLRQLLQENNSK